MTNLEIEAFLAVVRLGSITAAAQAIFITQPALSRRLQTLEEELGYPLFRRGKGQRNIQLTEEGKAFVRWQRDGGSFGARAGRLRGCLTAAK